MVFSLFKKQSKKELFVRFGNYDLEVLKEHSFTDGWPKGLPAFKPNSSLEDVALSLVKHKDWKLYEGSLFAVGKESALLFLVSGDDRASTGATAVKYESTIPTQYGPLADAHLIKIEPVVLSLYRKD